MYFLFIIDSLIIAKMPFYSVPSSKDFLCLSFLIKSRIMTLSFAEMVERQTRMLQAHVPSMGVRVQLPFSAWYFEQHYHLTSNNA